MSEPLPLPANPSLEQLRKQAKELLTELGAEATLADAQFALARRYGFPTWAKLREHVEEIRPPGIEKYEALAAELSEAYTTKVSLRVREVNWNYGTSYFCDFHSQEELNRRVPDQSVAAMRKVVAHSYGFDDWEKFAASFRAEAEDPRSSPYFMSSRPPFYRIDWKARRLEVKGPQSAGDWDKICAVIREHQITALGAEGISDAGMRRVAKVGSIIRLNICGTELSDEGARHLEEMPQLRELDMGGWTSPITDAGLVGLAQMKELRKFRCCWSQKISDAGLAALGACVPLEEVNAMGSPAGDGLVRALDGKEKLRDFHAGRFVSDEGVAALHGIPAFRSWLGENKLLLDGPFTNEGLGALKGLDGLFGVNVFWHCPNFSAAGLRHFRELPRLEDIGCDGKYVDDEAMGYLAAIPRLKKLMIQGTVAGDAGWEALSASNSIEDIWGRESEGLTGRGLRALKRMPALRKLAVFFGNVEDESLAVLAEFPALRALTPMGVSDGGFRHVGACLRLEDLSCMYCRETGDAATEHLRGLAQLRTYYAGATQITDRSLEILATLTALEKLEFWEIGGITDEGVRRLAALPRLKEIHVGGSPAVSKKVLGMFGEGVRVEYEG